MDIKAVKHQLMSHPHAQVRGTHVRNGAGTNLVARRRGEILLAAAKRDHKDAIGAVAEATGEVITPRLTARLVRGVEGGKATLGRLITVAMVGGLVVVFTWPALILGRVLYGVWVQLHVLLHVRRMPVTWMGRVLHRGWVWLRARLASRTWMSRILHGVSARLRVLLTPRSWIAAVAAVVALVAGWVVWTMTTHDTNGDAVTALWWSLQPGLGLAYTAWLVHAWGWSAVVTATAVITPAVGFVPVSDDSDDSTDDGADDTDEETTEETTETTVTPPAVGFVPVPDDPEVVAEEAEEVPEDFIDEPPGPEPPDDVATVGSSAGLTMFGDDDDDDDDEYDDDMTAAFGPNTKEKNDE